MNGLECAYVLNCISWFRDGPYEIERMPHWIEAVAVELIMSDNPDVADSLQRMNDLFRELGGKR